ncbi:hypothetical protein [Maridesulfovibrio sp.]|uniref:hypothetical protein n=1 Tax=Maridesulfovibrio sp. TaxID=2795000 RepID=UPI0029CAA901|nr:hypothetical protein [Maridesulfovibrio sp.]
MKVKQFKIFEGVLTVILAEFKPRIEFRFEWSPAMLPEGSWGRTTTHTRFCDSMGEAAQEFAEYGEDKVRSMFEYHRHIDEEFSKGDELEEEEAA